MYTKGEWKSTKNICSLQHVMDRLYSYVCICVTWMVTLYICTCSIHEETSELTKYAEQYYIWYDDKFLFWSNTNLHFDDMMMMSYMYISKKVENHLAASCKLHGSPQRLHHHALETFCNATNLITSKLKSLKKKLTTVLMTWTLIATGILWAVYVHRSR